MLPFTEYCKLGRTDDSDSSWQFVSSRKQCKHPYCIGVVVKQMKYTFKNVVDKIKFCSFIMHIIVGDWIRFEQLWSFFFF